MEKNNNSRGISFSGALFLVFLILKLTDNIDWSWWWVTSPLWIQVCLFVFGMGLGLLWIYIKEKKNGSAISIWKKRNLKK